MHLRPLPRCAGAERFSRAVPGWLVRLAGRAFTAYFSSLPAPEAPRYET